MTPEAKVKAKVKKILMEMQLGCVLKNIYQKLD